MDGQLYTVESFVERISDMVKGVNRRIVEVVLSDSEYFEKAVMFLRPGTEDAAPGRLSDEARLSSMAIEAASRKGIVIKGRPFRAGRVIMAIFSLAVKLSVIVCALFSAANFLEMY